MTQSDMMMRGPAHDDVVELAKAWAGTSVAYAIYRTGAVNLLTPVMIENLLVACIVCGIGFVVHEVAHREVARRFGAQAHFAADTRWLLLSLVIALAGIFVAAPGAVWHTGVNDKERIGKIALAGPISNFVLSFAFLLLYPLLYVIGWDLDILLTMCVIGFTLNAWMGLFNMIPGGPFDGAKVLAWSPTIYVATVVVGAVMVFYLSRQEVFIAIWGWMVQSLAG